MPDKHDDDLLEEERRMAELLSRSIGASGQRRRAVEEKIGLSSAGMSKILRGTVRLQVHHILRILRHLDIHPSAYFHALYPHIVPSAGGDQLLRLTGREREVQDAFNERLRQGLLELLGVKAEPARQDEAGS